MNIVENVARGSYDYVSVSRAIRRLRELGVTMDELEKMFPWRKRWITFVESLQDLPEDVTAALQAGELTPTHIQLALQLPTPSEGHSGLRTVMRLGWDTSTFKTFVQNRVDQLARAKVEAEAKGLEPVIPPANPQELIKYTMCLVCGYRKPSSQVVSELICEGCRDLAKYITDQFGPPEDAIKTIYAAIKMYFGVRKQQEAQKREFREESSLG